MEQFRYNTVIFLTTPACSGLCIPIHTSDWPSSISCQFAFHLIGLSSSDDEMKLYLTCDCRTTFSPPHWTLTKMSDFWLELAAYIALNEFMKAAANKKKKGRV
jgi:hypothetical protein